MPEVPMMTVSELTRKIKTVLEADFPYVWVSGEISNCTRAGSGHVYLTLKDESAQLRAIIWRSTAARLQFALEDGLQVVAAGQLEVYQARGTYQLIIEQCQPQGIGALEVAFRQLHEKLAGEGLFDPEHKQPLPKFPRRIALVTSPTGAAIRDMLQVITRRWRAVDLIILPVAVQGAGAAEQIADALRIVQQIPDVDVVITGRGGGSLEDLWAFNEEVVARAIFNCPLPVVSAVGHEIDVTIADLVADRRALTPSEAGELVVPQQAEVNMQLHRLREQLVTVLRQRAAGARMQLDAIASRPIFSRPTERIHDLQRHLDELDARTDRAIVRQLQHSGQQLAAISASLEALSPLQVLKRGYTLTRSAADGQLVRRADQLSPGQKLQTIFARGLVTSKVETVDVDYVPVGKQQP